MLVVSCCPQLQNLSLVGNRFKSLDELKQLVSDGWEVILAALITTPLLISQAKLEDLKALDLFNCPVTSIENYREKVFKLLPDLKSLDGFDQAGKEVNPPGEDDDEEEEEEEEEEDSDNEGPGLEYLQQEIPVSLRELRVRTPHQHVTTLLRTVRMKKRQTLIQKQSSILGVMTMSLKRKKRRRRERRRERKEVRALPRELV